MLKVEVELELEQLAQALLSLSPKELETLELMFSEAGEELKRCRREAHEALARGGAVRWGGGRPTGGPLSQHMPYEIRATGAARRDLDH